MLRRDFLGNHAACGDTRAARASRHNVCIGDCDRRIFHGANRLLLRFRNYDLLPV